MRNCKRSVFITTITETSSKPVFVFSAAEPMCFATTDTRQSEQKDRASALGCSCPVQGTTWPYFQRLSQLTASPLLLCLVINPCPSHPFPVAQCLRKTSFFLSVKTRRSNLIIHLLPSTVSASFVAVPVLLLFHHSPKVVEGGFVLSLLWKHS